MLAAQREFAEWLRKAYPDRLDEILAMGRSSALIGGLTGAALASFERGDSVEQMREELTRVLTPLEQLLVYLDGHPPHMGAAP